MQDHYKILGLSANATLDDVKKAYRREMRRYHPDLNPEDPNAHAKSVEINLAYEILSNSVAKQRFDNVRSYTSSSTQGKWNKQQQQAYAHAQRAYSESEEEAKERIRKWFYDRQSVRPTKKHRSYALQGNNTGLDDFLKKIHTRLGNRVWEYRVKSSINSTDRIQYEIRVVCNPSKCEFREFHLKWVENYYHGLFKPGTPEDAEYNKKIVDNLVGDVLRDHSHFHKVKVFFGVVGESTAPWRCYLDLSVVLPLTAYDVFFLTSVPKLSKFAKEHLVEVGRIFNLLVEGSTITPADLWRRKQARTSIARYAENVLRKKHGLRELQTI